MLPQLKGPQIGEGRRLKVRMQVLVAAMVTAITLGSPSGMKAQIATSQNSYGTAFAVTEDGDLVTSAHVVLGCNSVDVRVGSSDRPGAVTFRDQNSDLALVRLSQKSPHFAILRKRPEVRVGDAAITFGFPLPGILSRDGNLTVGYVSALKAVSDNPSFFQITTPIQPGSSGGPLLDNSGNVIGVVAKRLNPERLPNKGDTPQLVNFAVSLDVLRSFLSMNKIPSIERDSNQDMRVADVGDQARQFSYSIRCTPQHATAAPVEVGRLSSTSDERAVLYEEDLADAQGKSFAGSVVWQVVASPEDGRSPKALRGDIRFPGRIGAVLVVGQSLDENGRGNCRIELSFDTAQSPRGEIISVLGILMKSGEQTKGDPIMVRSIQSGPGSFAFSCNETNQRADRKLLRERAWIGLPVIYKDGHRAIVALSKGNSGLRAFNDVLAD